jgi:hypothetical protein
MAKKKPRKLAKQRRTRASRSSLEHDDVAPVVTEATILKLYVAAGGRCSFPGCPAYLMEEPLTSKPARLGNVAHIVGEKRNGPRGVDAMPIARRADFENLILMCTPHHAFIDKRENWDEYSVARLCEDKRRHEALVKIAVTTGLSEKTHAIRIVGQIRGHVVGVSDVEIRRAVFEHEHRHVESIIDVDLGDIPDGGEASYIDTGKRKIDAELRRRILPQIEDQTIKRISIFALARIPFICHFGYELGDKVPTTLYQKHRDDGEGWTWPADGSPIEFEIVEHGVNTGDGVAVAVSMSGGELDKVRRATSAQRILEIKPKGVEPSRTLLRSPATLANFRAKYHEALSKIETGFPGLASVDYFLAVPAPVALICGRDVLRDVVPRVVVHDLVDGEYVAVTVLETRSGTTPG